MAELVSLPSTTLSSLGVGLGAYKVIHVLTLPGWGAALCRSKFKHTFWLGWKLKVLEHKLCMQGAQVPTLVLLHSPPATARNSSTVPGVTLVSNAVTQNKIINFGKELFA